MRYLSVNAIKYLRKHLEEALARTHDASGELRWVMADKGRAEVEPWPDYDAWRDETRERVWATTEYCIYLPAVMRAS